MGELKPSADPLFEALAEVLAMEAPLERRLVVFLEKLRALGSPFAAEADRLVARLCASHAGDSAPQIGEFMPDFVLPDGAGRLTTLHDLLGTGPLVVSFNRGHWCPFCWIELDALASARLELAARGASVVSIMPDRQEFVRRFPATISERIRVLTDVDAAYAASLALAFWVDERLQQVMTEQNFSLETFQGSSTWLLPIPATFVVGQDGRVLRRFVDADFRRRMAVADILEAMPAEQD